jgi:hypothetical protein
MAQQLTISKDQRIALRLIAGRMGVQKLGGHVDVCSLEKESKGDFQNDKVYIL